MTGLACFSERIVAPLRRLGFATGVGVMLGLTIMNPALADASAAAPASATGPAAAGQSYNGTAAAAGGQQAAGAALPVGVDYRVHSGDALGVQVYGDQSLSQTATVLPDGSITYPLIGRVIVRGLTTQEASARIAGALGAYVRHPYVTVSVLNPAQYTILVLGNVKAPGKYALRSDARVSDAIAAAGGLGVTNGALPEARISLGTSMVQRVSLQRLFHDGDTSQNALLSDGSTVYIPSPATFDVEVVGAVDRPGNVTVNEGDRLSMAIAKAGNSPNSSADLNHIHVTRVLPDGKTQTTMINLYKTLENGDMSVDIPMHKGDVVFVPQARGAHGPSTGVSGAFFLLSHLAGIPVY